jgi:hypothetical protein
MSSEFSFLKVPQILHEQWSPHNDTNQPNPQAQIGYIETVELPNGTKQEYFVFLNPVTRQEMSVPMTELKKPTAPYVLFTPKEKKDNLGRIEPNPPDFANTEFQYNLQFQSFRQIQLPFDLHQQLVANQQAINTQMRDDHSIKISDDLDAQIKAQTEVDLSHFYQQHEKSIEENKNKERRYRESAESVLRLIHEMFSSCAVASLDDIMNYTRQPKQHLLTIVGQHLELIGSGENRGKYKLRK